MNKSVEKSVVSMKKIIRFYRANDKEHGFLSNLYKAEIEFHRRRFRCSEDAYQYGKPNRQEIAEWLIAAPSPSLTAVAAHGLLKWHVRTEWSKIRVERMRQVLRAKFTQHGKLREKLLRTREAVLVEASKVDAFWGTGKKGKGKNMLGQLLMELREQLAREQVEVER